MSEHTRQAGGFKSGASHRTARRFDRACRSL